MTKSRSARPMRRASKVSRNVLSVVRILIASYFLAMATGLVFEPASRTFLDPLLPLEYAQLTSTTYLFVTAFAIMVGVFLRPAALLLAVYIFWSGFLHYDLGGSQAALSAYWRDMALLGAILLIAVTEPGAKARFSPFARPFVAPRRINRDRSEAPSTARPKRTGHPAIADDLQRLVAELDRDDGTELENLFTDLWDNSAEELELIPVRA